MLELLIQISENVTINTYSLLFNLLSSKIFLKILTKAEPPYFQQVKKY